MIAIEWRRALLAGLAGAGAALLVLLTTWWLMRFGFMANSTVRLAMPWFSWRRLLAGSAIVLAGGPLIAIAYAIVFEYVLRRAGFWIGVVAGVMHAFIVWLGYGLVPWLFPPVAALFPDAFKLLYYSTAVMIAFAVAHILYGGIVGALYGRPMHPADIPTVITWREVYSSSARSR